MDFYKLLVLQLTAHFLSDYIFQSPKWSANKDTGGFKSIYLYKHAAVTFIFSGLLAFNFVFLIFSVFISAVHFVFDGLKKYLIKFSVIKNSIFLIDQFLHILTIIGLVYLFSLLFDVRFYCDLPDLKYILYIFALVLMLKPSNIFIREIFKSYNIQLDQKLSEGEELPNAGKLLGIIERILTLILIILGEFAAIGFFLAAKSILRFKEAQAQKAEYVLIGTMISFGIAILTGVILLFIKKFI